MGDLLSPQLRDYLDGLIPARPPELARMEAYAREHGFPIIGPACGHLCYQRARTIGARQVFELGSGYGYSTAFFACAVRDNGGGAVHHVRKWVGCGKACSLILQPSKQFDTPVQCFIAEQ